MVGMVGRQRARRGRLFLRRGRESRSPNRNPVERRSAQSGGCAVRRWRKVGFLCNLSAAKDRGETRATAEKKRERRARGFVEGKEKRKEVRESEKAGGAVGRRG
jgi:hypothetical protein